MRSSAIITASNLFLLVLAIYGFYNHTTIREIMSALIADNPSLPLHEVIYFWMRPYGVPGGRPQSCIYAIQKHSTAHNTRGETLKIRRASDWSRSPGQLFYYRITKAGDWNSRYYALRGSRCQTNWTQTQIFQLN